MHNDLAFEVRTAIMDDANQLRFQNGELTAEVRMLKSSLSNAHGGNVYMLSQLTARAHEQTQVIARLELRNEETVRENDHLRACLGMPSQRVAYGPRAPVQLNLHGRDTKKATTVTESSVDYLTGNEYGSHFAPHNNKLQLQATHASGVESFDSLVDVSEHQVLQPTIVVQEKEKEPAPKVERPREIGIGLANLTPHPIWEQDDDTDDRTDNPGMPAQRRARANNNFYVDLPGGEKLLVPVPAYSEHHRDDPTPHVPMPFNRNAYSDSLIPAGTVFSDSEHNRLSGNAVFIEEMDQGEQDRYWLRRGRTSPKHTAQEWRRYYEEHIRPAYIMKARFQQFAALGDVSRPDSSSHKITPNSGQQISPVGGEKASKSLETEAGASEEPEQALAKTIEVVKDVEDAECVEGVENVEAATPSAVTVVHGLQPPVVSTEVKSTTNSQEEKSTTEHDHHEIVSVSRVSKAASPATVVQAEMTQAVKFEKPELDQEESTTDTSQPIPVSTANKESNSMLEPLSGIPSFPPHSRDCPSSAIHQVVAGQHPSQQMKDVHPSQQMKDVQTGGIRDSRFFHAPSDEMGMGGETRQNRGSHQSHPGGSHQTNSRSNHSPDRAPFHSNFGPDSVEDLFAKPKNFHADPLAFRSVEITVPPSIDLVTALSKVRINSGTLFSSTYLETSKLNTLPRDPNNRVILVFLSGMTAQEFVRQSATHAIVHHLCKETKTFVRTEATLINSASRPITEQTQREILDYQLTRVVWIRSPGVHGRGNALIPLTAEAAWRALVHGGSSRGVKVPLHAWEDDSGVIRLEYASLSEARAAVQMIAQCSHYFGTAEYGFAPDPCGSEVSMAELVAWKDEVVEHMAAQDAAAEELALEEVALEQFGKVQVPPVEVQFADVYDFEANAVRERQIAELRAAKYLQDLALGKTQDESTALSEMDDASKNTSSDSSKNTSEVGVSTDDAESLEREILHPRSVHCQESMRAYDREREQLAREMEG